MIAQSRAPKCGQTKPPASRLERKTIKSTATCKAETLILKAPILTGRPSKMSDRQKIKPFSKTESAKYHPYPKIPNRVRSSLSLGQGDAFFHIYEIKIKKSAHNPSQMEVKGSALGLGFPHISLQAL